MPLGKSVEVTFGCTSCIREYLLATWEGDPFWGLLRHMSLLGWRIELTPAARLWCPTCAAKCPPPTVGGVTCP